MDHPSTHTSNRTSTKSAAASAASGADQSASEKGSGDEEPGQPTAGLVLDAALDPSLDNAKSRQQHTAWLDAIQSAGEAIAAVDGLLDAPLEATVLISHDDRVKQLNAEFRGQDKTTNVLSFPAPAGVQSEPGSAEFIGDVIIAHGVLEQEAQDKAVPIVHHLQHLTVHGVLHLLGYDHETSPEDADDMERLETAILAGLGVPDPYADQADELAPSRTTHGTATDL